MAGLFPPAAGGILLDGRSVGGWAPAQVCRAGMARTCQIPGPFKRGIARLPEGRRLFPWLTLEDNLRRAALLPAQPAGTLSGGEQQIGAIGRALMRGPRRLLREPVAGVPDHRGHRRQPSCSPAVSSWR